MGGWIKTNPKLAIRLALCFFCVGCLVLVGGFGAAQSSIFKFDPDIEFLLPAYNTSVGQSGYLYCDSYSWDDTNATELTFNDVFMTSGSPISGLDVSVQNANLTFNELGQSGANFDLANFGSAASITLSGWGSEPTQVEVDSTIIDNYTYTASTDLLSLDTEGTTVVLSFAGGLTVDDAIAIAIIVAVVFFAASFALIIKVRRNNE